MSEPFSHPPPSSDVNSSQSDQTDAANDLCISAFKCPSCNHSLNRITQDAGKAFRCSNNHSFDMAKEGYLNLLLAQHRRSRNPGDSDEMIRSRQRFLNAGYYQPLADIIVKAVQQAGTDQRILDMGCGEGYYMQQLRQASGELQLCGIDISKTAVRLAAKRKMNAQLAVDSAFNLPLHDSSINTAISVFSPISATETARVLTPAGRFIMIGPGEQHLSGLTAYIYTNRVPHRGNNLATELEQFSLIDETEINDTINIENGAILDLLKMTPYYWHAREEQQQQLANLKTLRTDIQFRIKTYQLK